MIALIQRVTGANVKVAGEPVGVIGAGIVALIGVERGDTEAEKLFRRFVGKIEEWSPRVATGQFGAHMQVSLVNDGPVTFWLQASPAKPS